MVGTLSRLPLGGIFIVAATIPPPVLYAIDGLGDNFMACAACAGAIVSIS